MPRYLLVFNAPEPMDAFMARSTAQEIQRGMEAWTNWKAIADKTIMFEFGGVVKGVANVGPAGTVDSASQASNYAFAHAATREAVVAVLQSHPHLQREGASIDVLELLAMPGGPQ